MFSVAGRQLSSCLSDIRLVTVGASEFVYSGVGVFVMGIVFVGEKVGQRIGSAESDFEVHVFEDVSDIGSFFTYICDACPFSCGVVRYLFVSVGCLGSVWFYWKELLCRMLCMMLSSCWYSCCFRS